MILDLIARKIKKQPLKPFGGMQIIFSGDFYQLPPVGNNDEPDTTKFCFESVAGMNLNVVFIFTFSPLTTIDLGHCLTSRLHFILSPV